MFTGTYQNSIDSKNRMIIPAKYRDQIGTQCILTRGFDRCLYIYSMEEWEVLVDKIKQLKQSDPDVRRFIREFFSNTEDGDFYGQNAALLATNGANVTIKNATVNSSAQNGNGIFSYGTGTTVNVSD